VSDCRSVPYQESMELMTRRPLSVLLVTMSAVPSKSTSTMIGCSFPVGPVTLIETSLLGL